MQQLQIEYLLALGIELQEHKMSKIDRPCPPVASSLVQEGGIYQLITQ